MIDTILLGFIALWLFIGGTLVGVIIFRTHDAVNTNYQAMVKDLAAQTKMLAEANEKILQLISDLSAANKEPSP